MTEKSNLNAILVVLICLSLILSLAFGFALNNKLNKVSEPKVDLSSVNSKLDTLASNDVALSQKIDSIEVSVPNVSTEAGSDSSDKYDTFYSVSDTKKSIAKDLAIKEIEDNDFVDEIYDLLKANGIDVDDDKDVVKVEAKDFDFDETEVDVSGDNAEVTMELNVYYIEDSDDEECGKVRVQVVFDVEELDRDQNYEDAEVTDYTISLEKKYDVSEKYCVA